MAVARRIVRAAKEIKRNGFGVSFLRMVSMLGGKKMSITNREVIEVLDMKLGEIIAHDEDSQVN